MPVEQLQLPGCAAKVLSTQYRVLSIRDGSSRAAVHLLIPLPDFYSLLPSPLLPSIQLPSIQLPCASASSTPLGSKPTSPPSMACKRPKSWALIPSIFSPIRSTSTSRNGASSKENATA